VGVTGFRGVGVRVGVVYRFRRYGSWKFFFGSIDRYDETNTFQL